jgi:hypothetical protein
MIKEEEMLKLGEIAAFILMLTLLVMLNVGDTYSESKENPANGQPIAAEKPGGGVQAEQKQTKDKSIPVIANRGIVTEIPQKSLAEIALLIKNISPETLNIMVKKYKAEAFAGLIVPWASFFFISVYMLVLHNLWIPVDKVRIKNQNHGNFDNQPDTSPIDTSERDIKLWIVYIVPAILLVLLGIWGSNRIADAVSVLANPEYYAIKDFVQMSIIPQ